MDKIVKILKYLGIAFLVLIIWSFLSLMCTSEGQDLGCGYYYLPGTWIVGDGARQDIPDYVTDVNYDMRYIIAKQNPGGHNSPEIFGKITYPKGKFYDYYWILDKWRGSSYGPMDSVEFDAKLKELNITIRFNGKGNHLQYKEGLEHELLKWVEISGDSTYLNYL